MANTDGIHGLVKEIADLPYVVFDTVGGYLSCHEPLREITFGEDTADGSFAGYASWAEKPFNRLVWTRLDRARAYARNYEDEAASAAFEDRIRLLSTTHFGLASPVLNVQREKKALELSEHMLQTEREALGTAKKFTVVDPSGSLVKSFQASVDDGFLDDISRLVIRGAKLKSFTATAMDFFPDGCVKTIFVILTFSGRIKRCQLDFSAADKKTPQPLSGEIKTPKMCVKFCKHGKIVALRCGGKKLAGDNFLRSFITYDGKKYGFGVKDMESLNMAGDGSGIRIYGDIHLPGELDAGRFSYDFYRAGQLSPVFVNAFVKYPYTKEDSEISTEATSLGRMTDVKWTEAVPFQLTPELRRDITVLKRNFMGELTSYPVSDFRRSIEQNKDLDSFNHQLTGGFVAVTDGESGLCAVNSRQVLGSMAHCPMRLRETNSHQLVSLAPFGTYFGRQPDFPSRSNGSVADALVLVSPLGRSLAPSYNGAQESFCLALDGFDGSAPDEQEMGELCAFADGCVTVDVGDGPVHPFTGDNVNFKAIRKHSITDSQLRPAIFSGSVKDIKKVVSTAVRAFTNIVSHQIRARR